MPPSIPAAHIDCAGHLLPSIQGTLTALDISAAKLGALSDMAEKLGLSEGVVRTVVADLRSFSQEWQQQAPGDRGGGFDRVLLDTPCSGENSKKAPEGLVVLRPLFVFYGAVALIAKPG